MAQSKELYLRSGESEIKAALGITKSSAFDRLIAFSRAELAELNPSSEQCSGVNLFIKILQTLPDEDSPDIQPIESGLKHDLSVPDRTKKSETKK